MITSRRIMARASRHTRRSMFCIERLYPTQRTCLIVYDPDISNVYDTSLAHGCEKTDKAILQTWLMLFSPDGRRKANGHAGTGGRRSRVARMVNPGPLGVRHSRS